MTSNDIIYYRSRLQEERDRAAFAVSPQATRVHRELAELYARLLADAEPVGMAMAFAAS